MLRRVIYIYISRSVQNAIYIVRDDQILQLRQITPETNGYQI